MSPQPQGLIPTHTIVFYFCVSSTWDLKPTKFLNAAGRSAYYSLTLVFIVTEVIHVKNSNSTKLYKGKYVLPRSHYVNSFWDILLEFFHVHRASLLFF